MKYLFFAITLFLTCFIAKAEFYTGNELKKHCENSSNPVSTSFCIGYVAGVVDAQTNIMVCPPTNSTVGQMEAIVKKYISENPSQLHKSADTVVTIAIAKDFPCKKK